MLALGWLKKSSLDDLLMFRAELFAVFIDGRVSMSRNTTQE